jgi:hypothetical protein
MPIINFSDEERDMTYQISSDLLHHEPHAQHLGYAKIDASCT